MDPGEQVTGTRDEHYNLVSVLYHALEGAETCDTYALDAEATGDERLAIFFREAQEVQVGLAERAKMLLGIIEAPSEPEVAPDVPPEGAVSPGTVAGGVPPDASIAPPDVPSPPEPEEERQPREEPPPGEERPERRGEGPPTSPTPREEPPAGEERPGRRTP
jgi:hypothetical protein